MHYRRACEAIILSPSFLYGMDGNKFCSRFKTDYSSISSACCFVFFCSLVICPCRHTVYGTYSSMSFPAYKIFWSSNAFCLEFDLSALT